MPRIPRNSLGTSFFHIIVQGIKREYIFSKDIYIEKYKSLLIEYMEKYNVNILAYCIMNNHAHILLFTEDIKEMSKFMKCINTSYGHYYNHMENRVGFVFRDRYLSEPIYNETYLLQCIAYIHMNPVKAHMVNTQNEYKYSSYNDYMNRDGIVTEDILKIVFGSSNNYMELFLMLTDEDMEFIDYEVSQERHIEIIDKYCKKNNLKIEQIIDNDKELLMLVKYLIYDKNLYQTEVANALNIHRLRITRLLKREQK